MRFAVDAWQPDYGSALDVAAAESEVPTAIDAEVPIDRWAPLRPTCGRASLVFFVDGVRRVEAGVWITEADGGRVLGVHILGPGAAELIQLVAIPMGMGADKADFDRAMAMHPTAAEELVTFKKPSHVYRGGVRR